MLIATEIDLGLGDRISCSYFLPDESKVVATGEVVRITKTGDESKETLYGIRYTTIGVDMKEKIEKFVKKEQGQRIISPQGQKPRLVS